MADWNAVKSYLASNYKCELISNDRLKLLFTLDDGRSQVVVVGWAGPSSDRARWVDFQAPIGRIGEVDLEQAMRGASEYSAGGISALGDLVALRVSVPLENLDKNEIEEPLELVCIAGDALEHRLTGADDF